MNGNPTIRMGNRNHRSRIPKLVEMLDAGTVDPTRIITRREQITDAIEVCRQLDLRRAGWIRVELKRGG